MNAHCVASASEARTHNLDRLCARITSCPCLLAGLRQVIQAMRKSDITQLVPAQRGNHALVHSQCLNMAKPHLLQKHALHTYTHTNTQLAGSEAVKWRARTLVGLHEARCSTSSALWPPACPARPTRVSFYSCNTLAIW